MMIYKNWPRNAWTNYKLTKEGIIKFFLQKINYYTNIYEKKLQEHGYFEDG